MIEIVTNLQLLAPFFLFLIFAVLFFFFTSTGLEKKDAHPTQPITIPKPYPLIGHYLALKDLGNHRDKWLADIVKISPAATFTLHHPLGRREVITGNPANNPLLEKEILKETMEKSAPAYNEVKDMVYTHAALCESMKLYPPVPMDSKEAVDDDVLEDGTMVKKGTLVSYHVYAMGRLESIWGEDWEEFKPERWLEKVESGKWKFVGRDSFTYPVFQAGPRMCLGKEMAFMQMQRVVAGIMRRFRIVPVVLPRVDPHFISFLSSHMEGGFPVKITHMKTST
ncbi:hypothetical protein VNO78_17406 [Psophocarpus tetragonolobus]|uniref:Cytochrome P450 n=1 Tax=Psophocarpus tetragonolobus TaxID=3891 RepID=A0AAN9SMQ8_PSOTE